MAEAALIASAAIGIAAAGGKMYEESKAANAEEVMLNKQAEFQQLQYQQKTINNLDILQKTLDAQTAAMTVRGTAFTSPSYNAIQRNTMNIGARQMRNFELEDAIDEENINVEKGNVKNKLWASIFGDVGSLAQEGAGIATKLPTKG